MAFINLEKETYVVRFDKPPVNDDEHWKMNIEQHVDILSKWCDRKNNHEKAAEFIKSLHKGCKIVSVTYV